MLVAETEFKVFYDSVVSKATRRKEYNMSNGQVVTHFFKGSRMIGRKVWSKDIGKDVYETVFTNKEYGRFNYEAI